MAGRAPGLARASDLSRTAIQQGVFAATRRARLALRSTFMAAGGRVGQSKGKGDDSWNSWESRGGRGKDFGQSLANSMHGTGNRKGSEKQLGSLAAFMLPKPQTNPDSP